LALSGCAVFRKSCPTCRYSVVNAKLPRHADYDRVQETKSRFLQLQEVLCIRDFLSGWFHGAAFDHIRRGNLEAFVAYAFYCQQYQDLSDQVKLTEQLTTSDWQMH